MSEIELCPPTCRKWHTKQFVADKLHVSLSMVYRYIKSERLQVGELGGVYCPWIQAFLEGKFKHVQIGSNHVNEDKRQAS